MKALIYNNKDGIRLEDINVPVPDDNQALLKVKAAAICGTDLRIRKSGHRDIPEGTSRILGHELSGEVVQVGKNVTSLKEGIRVAIAPVIGCGKCKVCLSGDANICDKCRGYIWLPTSSRAARKIGPAPSRTHRPLCGFV